MRSRARRGRTLGGAVAVGARDLADGAAVRLDAVHHREEARGVGVEVLRRQSEDSAGLADGRCTAPRVTLSGMNEVKIKIVSDVFDQF